MASLNDNTVVVQIKTDNDGKGIDDAVNGFDKLGGKIADVAKAVGVALLAAGAATVAFGISASKAYAEVEADAAQLHHAVVDVSHATEEQYQATSDLADALERKGVLDGDNIKLGLAQLSTFGLSNKAVQALGGSLADLAVNQFGVNASGEQLSDTANMIAKALNGQFGILEKSGIRFTDAQKSMIQYGTEMQKVDAINQGFAQNLKFTNDIAKDTAEGAMARLKVQAGNVQEAIGKVINDAFVPFIKVALDAFDSIGGVDGVMKILGDTFSNIWKVMQPVVNGFIQTAQAIGAYLAPKVIALWGVIQNQLAPALRNLWHDIIAPLADVIGHVLVFAVGAAIDAIRIALSIVSGFVNGVKDGNPVLVTLATILGGVAAGFIAYNAAMTVAAVGLKIAAAAQLLLNTAMELNPIGLVIGVIGGLVGALALLGLSTANADSEEQRLNQERQKSIDVAKALKDGEDELADARYKQEGASLAVEAAQKRLNDAIATYGANSLEARQAAHDLTGTQNDLAAANKSVEDSTNKITAAQQAQIDATNTAISTLDKLNGKSVTYYINGKEMVAQKLSNGQTFTSATFADGGFTGTGGKNDVAGVVHKGEFVIPQSGVDQSTGRPLASFINGQGGAAPVVNNREGDTIIQITNHNAFNRDSDPVAMARQQAYELSRR